MQANTTERTWQQASTAHPPVSRLWQVPLFLLGVTAAMAAWWHQPAWPQTPAERAARALKEALTALENGDAERARQAAHVARELVDHTPQLAGNIHFVVGSAQLLGVERASSNESMTGAALALSDLEKARELGVTQVHEPRLAFRLIKAKFLSGTDPTQLTTALEKLLEAHAVDRLEGYALVATMALRKSPPDLETALRANEKLLAQAGLADPNPARMQRGELLIQLKRREEARVALARIPPSAREYADARHLRAWTLLEDEQWQEAAALCEEAVRHAPPDTLHARQGAYYLGQCLANLGRTRDAIQAWQQLQSRSPESEEALAAAVARAVAHQAAGQGDQSLGAFVAALRNANAEWTNRYLEIAALRRLIEESWSRWFEAGDHVRARELARLYRRVDLPGEADLRLGQTCQAAGLLKLRQADLSAGLAAEDLLIEARQLFLEAGDAFAAVARLREAESDYGDRLWAATENLLRAQEYSRAIVLLEKCLALNPPEGRRHEMLVGLAESHQALGHADEAARLIHEALVQPGPRQIGARYLLALIQIDQAASAEQRAKQAELAGQYAGAQAKSAEARTHFAAAETSLRQLLAMPVSQPEPAEIRQAHFALAYVAYQRRQYGESATAYEEALARYPTHPQSMQARYGLAESYREAARAEGERQRTAETENARKYYEKRKETALEQALANYRQLAFDLAARQAGLPLKSDQESHLRDARFAVGECLCSLKRFSEAVDVYEKLAENYANHPDGLEALLNLAESLRYLGKMDHARLAVERCRAMLSLIDDKALQPPHATRAQWLESIERVAKACANAPEKR